MAVNTALVYLEKVRVALLKDDTTELDKLSDITTVTAKSTWALVDATLENLRLLGLSDEQYEGIKQNLSMLKTVTASATSAMEQYGQTMHATYQSQEDAAQQVFDLVKQYIKWELDEEVKALERQKDEFDELIDKRKELLDLQKSEDDHNKSVEEKLKEIAKLQVRIDLLALDDSREAQAERAKLQEELAEKQGDLAETQRDYAIDQQKKALDDEQKSFDDEKDRQIEALQNTLSSEELLYQATLQRIQTEWQNGWDAFYLSLIEWNKKYGSDLESTIKSAMSTFDDAIALWGSPIDAFAQVTGDTYLDNGPGSVQNPAPDQGSDLDTKEHTLSRSDQVRIETYIKMMQANSEAWLKADGSTDEGRAERASLAAENEEIARELAAIYRHPIVKGDDGRWYHVYDDGTRVPLYRQGGVVDYTGLAMLHGGKAAEMVLNNVDVAKVYDLIHNTPSLIGRMVQELIGGGISGLGSIGVGGMNAPITVNITHNGAMTDNDARRYGDLVADTALERLSAAFGMRGVRNVSRAALKA